MKKKGRQHRRQPASGRHGRRPEVLNSQRFNSVVRQKEGIVQAIRDRKIARAILFVNQLVAWQLENEDGEHVVKSLCDLAKKAKEHGQYQLQLQLMERAIDLNDSDGYVLNQYADALFTNQKYSAALTAYDHAFGCGELVIGRLGRAGILKHLGHLPEALEIYEEVCLEHPEEVVAKTGRADTLKAMKQYDAALEAYQEAFSQHPKDAWVHRGQANTLRALGRIDEALAIYAEACGVNPGDVVAKTAHARILLDSGNCEAALMEYAEICHDHPESSRAFFGYAETLMKMGRLEEAKDAFEVLCEHFPEDDWVWQKREEALEAMANDQPRS